MQPTEGTSREGSETSYGNQSVPHNWSHEYEHRIALHRTMRAVEENKLPGKEREVAQGKDGGNPQSPCRGGEVVRDLVHSALLGGRSVDMCVLATPALGPPLNHLDPHSLWQTCKLKHLSQLRPGDREMPARYFRTGELLALSRGLREEIGR